MGVLKFLLEELKQQYDYIVVDTAPTLLVTDTLQIAKACRFNGVCDP